MGASRISWVVLNLMTSVPIRDKRGEKRRGQVKMGQRLREELQGQEGRSPGLSREHSPATS